VEEKGRYVGGGYAKDDEGEVADGEDEDEEGGGDYEALKGQDHEEDEGVGGDA